MHDTNKEYMQPLIENIQQAMTEERQVLACIQETRPNGFLVKTVGLFAFISFGYMPWRNNFMGYWNVVAPHLKGGTFWSQVYKIHQDPLGIMLNAQLHRFEDFWLQKGRTYNMIVLEKKDYGLFVDAGYHHAWRYGSKVSLYPIANMQDPHLLQQSSVGDILMIKYWGKNHLDQWVIGNQVANAEFLDKGMVHYIGSTHTVTAHKNEKGEHCYQLTLVHKNTEKDYPAKLPITRVHYPISFEQCKAIRKKLKEADTILATIIGIDTSCKFILKFTDDFVAQHTLPQH